METKILITQTHIYKTTFQWDYQVWVHIGLHCFMEFGQIFQNDTETQEKKLAELQSKTFPGVALPQTPVDACAFSTGCFRHHHHLS